ncbi:unnamed protein product [Brugia pahangi]|uniref:Uncharacterized protein n=1 Tax=Brugia pahangi TaxID=6280 RepID=A0A0N4TBE0_BRUPA|nr:unnamed protein product [Brugia pahangi]
MNYQKNNYASQLLLLNQQYYDKNDTLSIANAGNVDNEIALSLCHSDTTKDDNLNSDSDEEFAVHAYEKIYANNTFITNMHNGKCLNDDFIKMQSVSDDETTASSAPYFSRNNYRTAIFKVNFFI